MLIFDIVTLLQELKTTKMHYNRISRLDVIKFKPTKMLDDYYTAKYGCIELFKWKNKSKFDYYDIATKYGHLKLLKMLIKRYKHKLVIITNTAVVNNRINILNWLLDTKQFALGDDYIYKISNSIRPIKWLNDNVPDSITFENIKQCFHNIEEIILEIRNNPQFTYATLGSLIGGTIVNRWFLYGGNIDEIMAFIGTGIINLDYISDDKTIPLMDMIKEPMFTQDGINMILIFNNFKVMDWIIARNLGKPDIEVVEYATYYKDQKVLDYLSANFYKLLV